MSSPAFRPGVFFKKISPGILCLILAFAAGSPKNPMAGFLGFLSFFVIGVTLLVEALKSGKETSEGKAPPASPQDFCSGG